MNSQKLKLSLEALLIQSFATTHVNASPGTILGYSTPEITDALGDTEKGTGDPTAGCQPQQPLQPLLRPRPSQACPPLQITPVIQCNG